VKADLCAMHSRKHILPYWLDPKTHRSAARVGSCAAWARGLIMAMMVMAVGGCARLDALPYAPQVSPEAFLQQQPSLHVGLGGLDFVWCQPSSSVMVFFVAFFTIGVGYSMLARAAGQRSRQWWGVGLLLSGFGALLAGISYQAFGYEIKCAGREFCTLTSWWEIFYMFFSALGMAAFLVAAAYSNASGQARKILLYSAFLGASAYTALLFYGAFAAIPLLVSFEFMALFSTCIVVFFLALHGRAWAKAKDPMNRALLHGWLIFVAVFVAYLTYQSTGISARLWENGIWFTENDVLHLGMIYWVYFVGRHVRERLQDRVG
jgi:hypothetical protein